MATGASDFPESRKICRLCADTAQAYTYYDIIYYFLAFFKGFSKKLVRPAARRHCRHFFRKAYAAECQIPGSRSVPPQPSAPAKASPRMPCGQRQPKSLLFRFPPCPFPFRPPADAQPISVPACGPRRLRPPTRGRKKTFARRHKKIKKSP